MRPGVWNIVLGLLAVAAGASGKFALIGTGSTKALIAVGGVIALIGVIQLVRSYRAK
jgi:hypothetical protein